MIEALLAAAESTTTTEAASAGSGTTEVVTWLLITLAISPALVALAGVHMTNRHQRRIDKEDRAERRRNELDDRAAVILGRVLDQFLQVNNDGRVRMMYMKSFEEWASETIALSARVMAEIAGSHPNQQVRLRATGLAADMKVVVSAVMILDRADLTAALDDDEVAEKGWTSRQELESEVAMLEKKFRGSVESEIQTVRDSTIVLFQLLHHTNPSSE